MQVTSVSGNNFITPEVHRIAIHRNGTTTHFKRVGLILDAIKVREITARYGLRKLTNAAFFL